MPYNNTPLQKYWHTGSPYRFVKSPTVADKRDGEFPKTARISKRTRKTLARCTLVPSVLFEHLINLHLHYMLQAATRLNSYLQTSLSSSVHPCQIAWPTLYLCLICNGLIMPIIRCCLSACLKHVTSITVFSEWPCALGVTCWLDCSCSTLWLCCLEAPYISFLTSVLMYL